MIHLTRAKGLHYYFYTDNGILRLMIERLAQQFIQDFTQAGKSSEAASALKSIIEAKLRQLNLVTREEFDAQQAVLARTRMKLESLEQQLATLEQHVNQHADK